MTGAMMTKPKGILKAVPTIIPVNDCEDGVRVVEGSGGSLEREKALLMLRGLHRDRARKTTRCLNYSFGDQMEMQSPAEEESQYGSDGREDVESSQSVLK